MPYMLDDWEDDLEGEADSCGFCHDDPNKDCQFCDYGHDDADVDVLRGED